MENIVDPPSYSCRGFESSYHFLFQCPKHTTIRNIYYQDEVLHYIVHGFLYGVETAADAENEILFIKDPKDLTNSKRTDIV